jgi:hypothetical protein
MTALDRWAARYGEEWAARYLAGATLRQIADEAGVGHTLVREVLQVRGVPMRRAVKPTDWHARLPALLAQGLSCAVIGQRLGKDRATIGKAVRRLGLREPAA